jgi:hypothetical protein
VSTGGEINSGVVQQSGGDVVEVRDGSLLKKSMSRKGKRRRERDRDKAKEGIEAWEKI